MATHDDDDTATVTAIDEAPSAQEQEVEETEVEEIEVDMSNRLTKSTAAALPHDASPIELNDGMYSDRLFEIDLSGDDDEKAWETWALEGAKLDRITSGHQWWRGDWILAGEGRFGELAYAYFDDDEYDPSTLNQFVRVSVAFPKETDRRDDLSWTHHKSVASLPTLRERKKVLTKAAKERWSDAELRAYVRTLKTDDEAEPTDTTKTREHFRVSWEVDAARTGDGEKLRDAVLRTIATKAKALGVEVHNLEANPASIPAE